MASREMGWQPHMYQVPWHEPLRMRPSPMHAEPLYRRPSYPNEGDGFHSPLYEPALSQREGWCAGLPFEETGNVRVSGYPEGRPLLGGLPPGATPSVFGGSSSSYGTHGHQARGTRGMVAEPHHEFSQHYPGASAHAAGIQGAPGERRPRDIPSCWGEVGAGPAEGERQPWGIPSSYWTEAAVDPSAGDYQPGWVSPTPPIPVTVPNPPWPEQPSNGTIDHRVEDAGYLLPEERSNPHAIGEAATTRSVPLQALGHLQGKLILLRDDVFEVERALLADEVRPAEARDVLAQMEAQLDELQCKGIDSVSTAGLAPGAEEAAKSLRKELTHKAESLQRSLDAAFERIRTLSDAR
mmetsp:Transcript_26672/g.58633  ORF Transcript_26672/g.58633 Transcript_26672/m.58633 type:complete len:352 (+) Transcript_26672:55-1110(+)